MREIQSARDYMASGEYIEAVRHYGIASKLLNDRPGSQVYKSECTEGIAEGLYLAALEEDRTGRRDRAIKLMGKAVDLRHPKARRQLEIWNSEADPDASKTDVSDITHRRNEKTFKEARERERRHLKRARQLLAQRELDRALDECELVLVDSPYNQEALRLRESIQRKRVVILRQERDATRKAMIADVDEAWRPVYAVDAREVSENKGATVKKDAAANDGRTMEQKIIQRMKEMRLPSISFKPPATIIDAADYFRQASKDYDRPDLPIEQRGFNIMVKPKDPIVGGAAPAASNDADDFSETGADDGAGASTAKDQIPMISASNISFYEALTLVCESVDYKFSVQGPMVMIMHKDETTEKMELRDFPVLPNFLDKMSNATEGMEGLGGGGGFGGGGKKKGGDEDADSENEMEKHKRFFETLGVKWPTGSYIRYVKAVGRLFVYNTRDNLAEFENALQLLNTQPRLIEIETRFVEVCQDDLNSLGFEWILNGDYTLGLNRHVARALGIRDGAWSAENSRRWPENSNKAKYTQWDVSTETVTVGGTGTGDSSTGGGGSVLPEPSTPSTPTTKTITTYTPKEPASGSAYGSTDWKHWSSGTRNAWQNRSSRNAGIGKIGGVQNFSETKDMWNNFSNGERYLSTLNNHISGQDKAYNDQFMKVNAFLGSADLSMILHMLSQRSDTDLLSAPKVLTKPNEEASIRVVTEYIYPTDYDVQLQSSQSSSSSSGGSQSAILAVVEPQTFQMREVGVILKVTPEMPDEGNIIDLNIETQVVDEPIWKNYGMRIPFTGNANQSIPSLAWITEIGTEARDAINQAVAALVQDNGPVIANKYVDAGIASMNPGTITYYDVPMEQPFFHVREVISKVQVYPGATIVMGGLITEARKAMDDKIPFLGDIPIIGRLFRSHSEQTTKRNLLIFVTTRVVDPRGREKDEGSGNAGEVKAAPDPAAN